ncbi:MAG: FHA domain-containing protein [Phycisphaerales bacterium]
MTSLQIEILTGANAGRKLLLRQTRITFGRSTDRTLPIDLPFISREHGEFAFTDGKWTLVNHSNNGTSLNGKLVTTKPRPIKNIATVSIGDTDIFRVLPMPGDADQPVDTQDSPAAATTPATTGAPGSTSSRGKLWAGIGVFWIVAFGLIAFGLLNQSDTGTTTPDDSLPPALTADQITQDITHKPDKQTPDARRADTALAQAHESYALIDRRPDAALPRLRRLPPGTHLLHRRHAPRCAGPTAVLHPRKTPRRERHAEIRIRRQPPQEPAIRSRRQSLQGPARVLPRLRQPSLHRRPETRSRRPRRPR